MFLSNFICQLTYLIESHQENVDSSMLQALLKVQKVFNAFQMEDEKVLGHLKHQNTIYNQTRAMHQLRKHEVEDMIAECQNNIVLKGLYAKIKLLLSD